MVFIDLHDEVHEAIAEATDTVEENHLVQIRICRRFHDPILLVADRINNLNFPCIIFAKSFLNVSDKHIMRKCIACSSEGKSSPAQYTDQVYGKSSGSTSIRLCYSHSVEFFKTGQTNFVIKYNAGAIEEDLKKQERKSSISSYFSFGAFK